MVAVRVCDCPSCPREWHGRHESWWLPIVPAWVAWSDTVGTVLPDLACWISITASRRNWALWLGCMSTTTSRHAVVFQQRFSQSADADQSLVLVGVSVLPSAWCVTFVTHHAKYISALFHLSVSRFSLVRVVFQVAQGTNRGYIPDGMPLPHMAHTHIPDLLSLSEWRTKWLGLFFQGSRWYEVRFGHQCSEEAVLRVPNQRPAE